MDVSIAVSLIRGQMGNVVERAVNGAVETVLAEMLKVVGVKFEELKAQVMQMKKDMMVLQREKSQKEKENDNIRAKLRYTELKLKYYRQGVEEELQQRASASTLVWIQPPTLPQTQRSGDGGSPTETLSPFSVQTRSAEEALTSNTPECTSSQSTNRRAVRVSCPSSVAQSGSSDLLLPASLSVNSAPEPLDGSSRFFYPSSDSAPCKEADQEDECEEASAPPPAHALTLDGGQQSRAPPLSPHGSGYADSSTLACFAPEQVKQEAQVEKEVIYIKEEPEEEQEVMATLVLDCHVQQVHQPESEAQWSAAECPSAPTSQMHPAAFSSAGPSTLMLPPSVPPRPAVRPWSKDLSLYEEYKMQRSELRRRNILRRRELEKSLPQPLLADLVRERREKTRLRVARWRAKRKLQACLNQAQDHGGAAGLPQTGFPISQHQQLRAPCASSSQQRRSSAASQPSSFLSNTAAANSISAILPLRPSSSSSSLLGVPASCSYPPSSTSL